MRTHFVTLLVIGFITFLSQSCNEGGNTTSEVVKEINSKVSDIEPIVRKITYRPTITVSSGQSSNLNRTITSSLNHFTSLTVGVYDQQYAVVIKTDESKSNTQFAADFTPIQEQEFGDEIVEDEVVEETIAVEAPTAPNPELLVEEGPGVDPFGDGDELAAKGPESADDNSINFSIAKIDAAYLLGKFNPATHDDFTKVSTKHASRAGMYIRKDVYTAFLKMYEAALQDGVELKILSATRSFSGQKRIWEAKWTGKRKVSGQDLSQAIPFGADRAKKILEYSAMPGTSRHHWGTDLDLCALNNAYFTSGKGKEIYDWLVANAYKFGFHQPYTGRDTGRNTGHNEEKWHWSYTPISQALTRKYTEVLSNETITGFLGQETAPDIQILENYVLGINSDCK